MQIGNGAVFNVVYIGGVLLSNGIASKVVFGLFGINVLFAELPNKNIILSYILLI